jgi:hypothetical protein
MEWDYYQNKLSRRPLQALVRRAVATMKTVALTVGNYIRTAFVEIQPQHLFLPA